MRPREAMPELGLTAPRRITPSMTTRRHQDAAANHTSPTVPERSGSRCQVEMQQLTVNLDIRTLLEDDNVRSCVGSTPIVASYNTYRECPFFNSVAKYRPCLIAVFSIISLI